MSSAAMAGWNEMLGGAWLLGLQTSRPWHGWEDMLGGGLIAVAVGLVLVVVWLLRDRSRRERPQYAALARRIQQEELINDMGASKLQAEVRLLEFQAEFAKRDLEQRDQVRELNTLQARKLRMEIEALELEIEMRRRQIKSDDEPDLGY